MNVSDRVRRWTTETEEPSTNQHRFRDLIKKSNGYLAVREVAVDGRDTEVTLRSEL